MGIEVEFIVRIVLVVRIVFVRIILLRLRWNLVESCGILWTLIESLSVTIEVRVLLKSATYIREQRDFKVDLKE
jgi:hypothetical protein